jgi:hypothetical protein
VTYGTETVTVDPAAQNPDASATAKFNDAYRSDPAGRNDTDLAPAS